MPWRRAWQPTPVFWPGESHGQRSLAGCSPWGHKESDTTEATEHKMPVPAVIDGRFRSVQLLGWRSGKEPGCQCRRHKRHGFNPWVRKIPWRRKWQPTPVFLPGKSRRQRSLVGYSPWGHTESDLTEQAHVHALGMLRVLLPLASALLFSCSVVSNSLQPYKLQHARLPCPSPSFGACTNSGPLSW